MTVETQTGSQQPKIPRRHLVPLIVSGLLTVAGAFACAYAAARLSLTALQERARDLGLRTTVNSFIPLAHGMLFRQAIFQNEGDDAVYVQSDSAVTHGWLAPDSLEIRSGSFHLVCPWYNIATGTIHRAEFRDDGGILRFRVDLSAPAIVIDSPALCKYPVTLYDLTLTASGYRDPGRQVLVIEDGALGIRKAKIVFTYARTTPPDLLRQDLAARFDNLAGADFLTAFTPLAITRLGKPTLEGDLSVSVVVHTDAEKPETTRARVQVLNRCVVKNLSDTYGIDPLRKRFTIQVFDEFGGSTRRDCGPETTNWLALTSAPPSLAASVLTCIDPQFGEHHGISDLGLSAALTDQLCGRRRGGGYETISERLADVLWPQSGTDIARGAELAVLATHLEASLAKDEILTLFLNVAPGPHGIVGARDACRYYFGKQPAHLTVAESAFIALCLGAPERTILKSDGSAPGDVVRDIADILQSLNRTGLLSDKALEDASVEAGRPGWPLQITRADREPARP